MILLLVPFIIGALFILTILAWAFVGLCYALVVGLCYALSRGIKKFANRNSI
jgi:hypothetical protein